MFAQRIEIGFLLVLLLISVWISNCVVRDGTLNDLTTMLNSPENTELFRNYIGSQEHFQAFLKIVEPWLVSDVPVPLKTIYRQDYVNEDINCNSPRYAKALTGKRLSEPRHIVDFVPFGYDFDLLHIRLHESYHAVDAFVIYEATRTQSGIPKPLYFQSQMQSPRFAAYLDKIIYISATDQILAPYLAKVQYSQNTRRKQGPDPHYDESKWALEVSMRVEMINGFRRIRPERNTLKNKIVQALEKAPASVWGIQNDADEMIRGEALWHFKHCELQPNLTAVYFPCFSFKSNFHWLQLTSDMTCIGTAGGSLDTTKELRHYLWKGAPFAWPLDAMLKGGSTMRYHNEKLHQCSIHMGIGAAIHMSSIAEPVLVWMKKGGTVEQTIYRAVHRSIIWAARDHKLTPSLTARDTLTPWCSSGVHVSKLSFESQNILNNSIPEAVRLNPNSFPFLLPGYVSESISYEISLTAKPEWMQRCDREDL